LTVAVLPSSCPGFPVRERLDHLRDHAWETHVVDIVDGAGLPALLELRPRLVHVHSASVALRLAEAGIDLDCRVIVTATGEDLNTIGLEDPDHYRATWDLADAVHVASEALWQRALQRGCPPSRRHAVIPPAADTSYFDPHIDAKAKEGGGGLRILSVGPLVWAQGYEHALHAARLLLERGVDFEYRIVGEGDLRPAVLFARRQLELDEPVELLDGREPEDLKRQLAWADVFLNAAVAPGFTDAVAEAHAMGLPVVSTGAGVLDGVAEAAGVLAAPSRDPATLADQLARVAREPDLRRRLGQSGRARALSHFGLARQLSQFESLYRTTAIAVGSEL
jgi:colanic acid/amylovoran biosynthesis glycosyltransferase